MILLAGPNGAGKSTLYEILLAPRIEAPFINADLIQREELRDPAMAAAYQAAEIAENRRQQALRQGISFVSESTFSHPSKLELVVQASSAGFRVVLYHVNVRRPELSVARVAQRVGEGGHDVPQDKVRERYARSPLLIRSAVLLSDFAYVYDNSALNIAPECLLTFAKGQLLKASPRQPPWALQLYAQEIETMSLRNGPDAGLH